MGFVDGRNDMSTLTALTFSTDFCETLNQETCPEDQFRSKKTIIYNQVKKQMHYGT